MLSRVSVLISLICAAVVPALALVPEPIALPSQMAPTALANPWDAHAWEPGSAETFWQAPAPRETTPPLSDRQSEK